MINQYNFLNLILIFVLSTGVNSVGCDNGFLSTLNHITPRSSPEIQVKAVEDLIGRILPEQTSSFTVFIDTALRDSELKDTFHLEKKEDGVIHISGTTGVAAAAGFNHYLKYFCNCHISWEASQLNLPQDLPEVNITINFNDRFRYYQNVCTTSYSFVWWNWAQWEKHIDWMALNSFNLVLAFNGQEAIWDRVYRRFNLTQEDIDEHFTGPAFLSWLRMGNMRGWGGNLSSGWHARSIVLQKQILERMRSLGMVTVLPAFAGHLPRAFKRLYPEAKMEMMGSWLGFEDAYCCPYFLDPTEELFNKIGTAFLEEQIAEFGTDHVYNCDSFNENKPTSGDLTYLSNVGKAIFKAMTDVDSEAIWVLQNWMFVNEYNFWTLERAEAILTSVPIGKIIVLDLQSEHSPQYQRFNQYFGQPYIWCMLHNFGGTSGMFGSSSIINENPVIARHNQDSTMIGTGLTPEGINQNYVIYELMTETAWRKTPTNLSEWIESYATRRYGSSEKNATKAWQILQKTIYDYNGVNRIMGQSIIVKSPSFGLLSSESWYETNDLLEAWSSMLAASDTLNTSSAYLHDLVDITRQVFQAYGDTFYNQMVTSYNSGDVHSFDYYGTTLLDIFNDLDIILGSNTAFLVGPWIQSAKDAASDSEEKQQFAENARNQITLWGPRGEILDYAIKQWSGLTSKYLAPRWKLFLEYANDTLSGGTSFDQSYISNKIFEEIEKPFTLDDSEFPLEPVGNSVEIAQTMYAKWIPTFRKVHTYNKRVKKINKKTCTMF